MTGVTVITGSRLHFGPLSVAAPAGGRFGGVGVMIESPGLELTAQFAKTDSVNGDPETVRRIGEFLGRIRSEVCQEQRSAYEITVGRSIPFHRGFGSGTQLGLAVAKAVSTLTNEPRPILATLARRVGRGLRSAIGLYGFDSGGFLVDGGRAEANRLGTLVARVDFPSAWRFVLAMPKAAAGLSGAAEQSAFAKQPPMPASLTGELCRIVLMDWLPAVIEADLEQCSDSMYQFGHAVGEFFSPAQGGVFAHPRMSEWARMIRSRGIRGVAQTSWGPTLAALCVDETAAQQLQQDFANDPNWSDCTFEVVSARNRGASVVTLSIS